jgi:hypothetical protein
MQTCQTLRTEEGFCHEDFDCDLDHMCWYKTEEDAKNDRKKCMKLYSQEKFFEYGYKKVDGPDKIKGLTPHFRKTYEHFYNMDINMHFGRYCKSGVAVIIGENKMKCVTID